MNSLLIKRICINLFVLVLCFSFTNETILKLFIVFGQGHFLITYMYQRDRKVYSNAKLLIYTLIAASLFVSVIYFDVNNYIIMITAIHFLFHYLFDELKLFNINISPQYTYLLIPIIISYSAIIIVDEMNLTDKFIMPLMIGLLLFYGLFAYHIIRKKLRFNFVHTYFIGLFIVFIAIYSIFGFSIEKLFGFIVLSHYITWYLEYYVKVLPDSAKKKRFYLRVGFANAIVFLMYFLYVQFDVLILKFLFLPIYFYVWTLLHTLFTIRKADYVNSIRYQT